MDHAKFENMVAGHLLKYVHFKNDWEGDSLTLTFLRDLEKREIDFLICRKNVPLFAVECKTSDKILSPQIKYFSERTDIPVFYQVHMGSNHIEIKEHRSFIIPFSKFCEKLGL